MKPEQMKITNSKKKEMEIVKNKNEMVEARVLRVREKTTFLDFLFDVIFPGFLYVTHLIKINLNNYNYNYDLFFSF